MTRKLSHIAVAILLGWPALAQAEPPPSLIFPDPAHEIQVVTADKCKGKIACGHVLPESDSLARLILAELRLPFHREVITVSQCLRNFTGDLSSPNVLFTSEREGGYASQGLVLNDGGKSRELPNLRYVELVLNPQNVRQGELDIFSHELGHVMMSTVWPQRPDGRSPKQHVSMGITDEFQAFSEGWGISFQRLAYDAIPRYQELRRQGENYRSDARWLWHSNLDTRLRLDAVRSNEYIHRKVLPQVDTAGMGITDLIFLDHTSPLFDPCRLKNAQEMLASEGVIATLFYRINTDSILAHHYRSSVFYEQFLRDSVPAGMAVESLFTPLENILLKSTYVLHLFKDKLTERNSPFLEFINNWCTTFPEDKEELMNIFLGTTVGRTVTDSLGAIYEKLAYVGLVGNYNEYKRLRKLYEDGLARLTSDVLAQKVAFDANVGPQLWVENTSLSIPVTLWAPEPKFPLDINVNTASVFDLASFPGMSLAQAQSVLRARDKQGWFKSLDEARQAGFKF